jgi:hypothetical protein
VRWKPYGPIYCCAPRLVVFIKKDLHTVCHGGSGDHRGETEVVGVSSPMQAPSGPPAYASGCERSDGLDGAGRERARWWGAGNSPADLSRGVRTRFLFLFHESALYYSCVPISRAPFPCTFVPHRDGVGQRACSAHSAVAHALRVPYTTACGRLPARAPSSHGALARHPCMDSVGSM